MNATNALHSIPSAAAVDTRTLSKAKLWTSRILVGLPTVFMAWDATMKLILHPMVREAAVKMGFSFQSIFVIGILETVAVLLLTFKRTRIFGAVYASAYLGGAIATHVHLGDPLFSHALFPLYFAAMIWGGLYIRDERVRALSPFTGSSAPRQS